MSEQQKKGIESAMAWILRGMTALGAIFLIDMHEMIKENNALLHQHLREDAADKVQITERVRITERDLDRLENRVLKIEMR